MKFCTQCGAPVALSIPAGEDRERHVCGTCSFVHYENPKTVVGCLPTFEGKLLLCRRAIEPSVGRWTMPAGYLELGEGAVEGAVRETREETGSAVEVVGPHALLDIPHIGQTYTLFRARLPRPDFGPTPESLEVRLFEPGELPFGDLAFPVVHFALRYFLDDLQAGQEHLHLGVLRWSGTGERYDPSNYRVENRFEVPLAASSGPASLS